MVYPTRDPSATFAEDPIVFGRCQSAVFDPNTVFSTAVFARPAEYCLPIQAPTGFWKPRSKVVKRFSSRRASASLAHLDGW
jgi:hypothetical protein